MNRLILTCFLIMSISALFAQNKYRASNTRIKLEGTSTLHDWHMVSEKGTTEVDFHFDGTTLATMPSLSFTVQSESLKSNTKGLNKNAYKVLNTKEFPAISFASNYATVHSNGVNSYLMSVKGKLTIAGTSKDIWVSVVCMVNPDQTIQATGTCKLKMSEYNLDPPSFMLGAMKTGNEVTIKFNALLRK